MCHFSIQDNYLQSSHSTASRESCKTYGRKSELKHYSLWTPESCGEIYDSKIGYGEVKELFKQRGRHAFQGRSPVNQLFTV
ncbi:hypothetical protein M422DRAFT_28339 [Sphaerobolus stellatus SS14]|nr:hypothetical protein M422DRAFT_28339 [Sphaerobolus stellatus SS14]